MPEIKGGNGKEPYVIQHEEGGQTFIRPSLKMDIAFSGETVIKLAADQNNLTPEEVIKKLEAGENIVYENKHQIL